MNLLLITSVLHDSWRCFRFVIFDYVLLNIARLRGKPGLNLKNCLYLGQFISILLFKIYQAPTYRKILPERDYAVTKAKARRRPQICIFIKLNHQFLLCTPRTGVFRFARLFWLYLCNNNVKICGWLLLSAHDAAFYFPFLSFRLYSCSCRFSFETVNARFWCETTWNVCFMIPIVWICVLEWRPVLGAVVCGKPSPIWKRHYAGMIESQSAVKSITWRGECLEWTKGPR